MLNSKCGNFTQDEFKKFLLLCNTEIVPKKPYSFDDWHRKKTCTRFTSRFIGNNMKFVTNTLDECNRWITALWQSTTETLDILDRFWKKGRIKGAGTSFPTMIMYLKDRDSYNVWLRPLAKAINTLMDIDRKPDMTRNAANYQNFNSAVNEFMRRKYNLKPQEVDYVLFRLSQ